MNENSNYSEQTMIKAIALISGGLDSQLAVKVIQNQRINVHGLCLTSLFQPENTINGRETAVIASEQLSIPLEKVDITEELIELVRSPQHGHGSEWNPCIDCRILQLREATRLMRSENAHFIITGEVVGQRPMTQTRDTMNLIEKEADLKGLVVRPLSAQLLEKTIPEEKGWIAREELYNLQGRTRKPQIQMAKAMGISHYPNPAGGCRLTEPGFARRIGDLMEHDEFRKNQVRLLHVGRHFRLTPEAKLVVGREEAENYEIEELAEPQDVLMKAIHFPGPTSLIRGEITPDILQMAGRITARYGKGKAETMVEIQCHNHQEQSFQVAPLTDEEELKKMRV